MRGSCAGSGVSVEEPEDVTACGQSASVHLFAPPSFRANDHHAKALCNLNGGIGTTSVDDNHLNLVRLGQEVTKDSSKKRKAAFKQTMVDDAYDISRYQPAVKLMLEVGGSDRFSLI